MIRTGLIASLLLAAGCSAQPDAPAPPSPSEARALADAKAMIPADELPDDIPDNEETTAP